MTSSEQKRAQLEEILRRAERAPVDASAAGGRKESGQGDAAREERPGRRSSPASQREEEAVAIVGVAGRYPGAETLDEFWANLIGGRSSIAEMSGARRAEFLTGCEAGARAAAERVRHFGLLRDIYRFDAPFFGISRREAEVMDPHMRLLLEAAWSCVENAGYRPQALGGRTGVFVSFYNHEYAEMLRDLEIEPASEAYLGTATTGAIFANRISFLLGLTGPSEVYNTACSTALVALHRCVQAIRAGECDQAIVAGASLLLTPSRVLALGKMGILNETGRCNPYSHPANKETIGEGVGALLVKPLARAVAEGDYVYAVVRGSDVSHHGNRSGGMTLPSADALAELMTTTYRRLGADAVDALRYIEGHGAGGETDVIELRGIENFLATVGLAAGRKIPVGSVKSNIGFGEASGGMAQLTKCVLALQAGEVPATLNFERTDPVFDYEGARLRIAAENVALAGGAAGAGDGRSVEEACVSVLAYGLGGTNAHVVLGGHTAAVERAQPGLRVLPLIFSAGTEAELAEYVRGVAMHLACGAVARRYREIFPSESQLLHAAARTLIGRERQQRCRVVFLVGSVADWLTCAAAFAAGTPDARIVRGGERAGEMNGEVLRGVAVRWVAGEVVADEAWLGGGTYRKLPLPTVRFRGEEYRLARKTVKAQAAEGTLEERWRVEEGVEGKVAEIVLRPEDCLIAQHRVDGQPVLPGVAYVALLGALVRKVYGREHYTIEDLAWTMPLVLERGAATVRCEWQRGGRFRILHQERGVVCCTGRLVLEEAEREAKPVSARVGADVLKGAVLVAERAAYWSAANAAETRQWHGPELRRLEAIYRVGETMVGAMAPAEGPAKERNEIGILDSALGVCRGFAIAEEATAEAVVPFAVERIRVLRPIPTGRRLYVAAERRSGKLVRYDLSIEDGAGEVFAVLTGYFAKTFTGFVQPAVAKGTAAGASAVAENAGRGLCEVLLAELREAFAGFLKCEIETVPTEGRLDHLGLDSIGLNALTEQLRGSLGVEMPATTLFEYGSLREVAEFLVAEFGEALGASRGGRVGAASPAGGEVAGMATRSRSQLRESEGDDIAVVGMGGLFPGAGDVHAFWRRICAGDDLIAEMPETRRRSVYEVYRESLRELKVVQGGFVEEADRFDAGFFGFSEAEVMAMDPQQRLFLEAAWASIEDAGYHPPALSGQRVGVYVGAIVNEYGTYLGDVGYPVSMFHEGTGGSLAGIANRVSYVLNLTGPSQAIDAACCSSLYALDRAVADLRSGTCDAALAGGVSFIGCAAGYQMYSAMKYLAKDWRCKAFAAGGDGWAKAEVFASVFLKRHADAVRDGDPIYGVIKATGTNHGGRGYFYTQPNSPRHVELVREVLRKADVAPESLVHIEAHGSGTEMGDVLEFNSLARALKEYAAEKGVTLPANGCGIGSIKSNLGHAEAGSGILGFIKSVLLLHSGRIPRTLHVGTTSANLREAGSPLALMREGRVLRSRVGAEPARCASVHSFNFSGATAHALVAEHVGAVAGGTLGLTQFPICLSAKTPAALAAYRGRLARFLREETGAAVSMDRLAFTLACSRSQFAHRWGAVVGSREELIARLEVGEGAGSGCFAGVAAKKAGARSAEVPRLSDAQVEMLMRRWVEDAGFEWLEVLRGIAVQKINLPTYPFDHSVSYFPQVEAGASAVRVKQNQRMMVAAAAAPTVAQAVTRATEAAGGSAEAQVAELFGEVLGLTPEEIDLERAVSDYGFDSAKVVALAAALSERFGLEIKPPDLFEFAKPAEIVAFVGRAQPDGRARESKVAEGGKAREGVAIIGMSGQLPGAADLEEFWENLVAGRDAIAEIPSERWDWRKFAGDAQREANKTEVRWGGFIADVTTFDPLFFGISPREAEWMDPQQRLLLMYAWRAIEDAGYAPSSLAGTDTGVFVATGSSAYGTRAPGTAEGFNATGAIPSLGPNRLSHFLDLRGPSEPVETSCSSGLVAVHRAVRALQAGECGMAIVGGINTLVTPDEHLSFSKAGMLAKDGRCKTFSDQADGYGRGEGVGFVVLKPLAAAERDGDRILAVIRGSAVNHGGRANSLTAPSPRAQAEVLRAAYRAAGVDPRTVGYIETHGTGTALGDPIEINGLKTAWRALHAEAGVEMAREPQCALGAVKTNIGHLELAAGIAGLLKVLLQLRHRTLVRSLHCERVNPYVDLQGTPFWLVRENREWVAPQDASGRVLPRRAGVSSFGFGGVNAHVVLEEYCAGGAVAGNEVRQAGGGGTQLIVLSARNEARLREAAGNLARFLERNSEVRLADVAYTLQVGRDAMSERLALVAESIEDARAALRRFVATGEVGAGGWRGRAAKREVASQVGVGGDAGTADWGRIAARWVEGAKVEWASFWKKGTARRIGLPTYPFAKDRCWLEAAPVAEPERGVAEDRGEDVMFLPRWERVEIAEGETLRPPRRWVVMQAGAVSPLVGALAKRCGVRWPGAEGGVVAADEVAQAQAGTPIDVVVFVSGVEPLNEGNPHGEELALLRVAQAMKRRTAGMDTVDFFVVTTDKFAMGAGSVVAAGGGLTGLAYAIAQGEHRFRVRNVDVAAREVEDGAEEVAERILCEPASDRGEVVRLQAGGRYRRVLLPLDASAELGAAWRRNGCYVILGGAGRVGEAVTRFLMETQAARVVWIGRRTAESAEVQAKLRAVRGAVASGSVDYVAADACDAESLRAAIGRIRREHGATDGAMFAASVFSFANGFAETTEREFLEILAVKTRGSVNFRAALEGERLDFLVYFSSAQSFAFSGAANLSAYAAGITFTDALVEAWQAGAAFPIGSIDWGFWESGEAGAKATAGALDARTGCECLTRFVALLRAGVTQRVVGMRISDTVRVLVPLSGERAIVAAQAAGRVVTEEIVAAAGRVAPAESEVARELEGWIVRLLAVQVGAGWKPALLEGALAKWWAETRRLLTEHAGWIAPGETGELWARWDEWRRAVTADAALAAQSELVDACLRALPEILAGRVRATEVLFPGAAMERVERVYRDNGAFDYFNAVVADVVRGAVERAVAARPDARVRVLEIGAGTGGTTAAVLERLRGVEGRVASYVYTDVSRAFLAHGERRFADGRGFMEFRVLDIEAAEGFGEAEVGSFDVVIAANVLHATRDIARTLRNAKAALKRNGLLVLNEIAGPSLFAHVTFGLLDGWWLFEDAARRIPGSPGLYPDGWDAVLREEGFGAVSFPARVAHGLGQQVVVAASDGVIRRARRTGAAAEGAGAVTQTVKVRPARMTAAAGVAVGAGLEGDAAVERVIRGVLSSLLKIPEAQFERDVALADYGVDSILGVSFVTRLGDEVGVALNSAILFEYATIERLAGYLRTRGVGRARDVSLSPVDSAAEERAPAAVPDAGEIAVIGMAGQFPGAADVGTFWENLVKGRTLTGELPAEYGGAAAGGYRWGGVLEERACFDPLFFNVSPREAESMTPHQRLILQESWKALEDAGINPRGLAGKAAGLFIGAEPSGYEHETFTGASDAIVASRLSYFLNLKGPALVVNTGCSSSAAAIHLACESLRTGGAEIALAGGVFATMDQGMLAPLARMGMLSASGCCRPFDAGADGTVFSEGVGVVVLKRLRDAIADGDLIHGVIVASAMNQDGASNGLTAPNGEAQEDLVAGLYRRCGIEVERIGYVETHGTGTRLGDPVEANALVRAFRQFTTRERFCALGSVKGAIGHASAASGVISLIKVLLMLRHGRIPPQGNFSTLNPLIEIGGSAFYINEREGAWVTEGGRPRMAAMNSFGHSGTNVHLVVRAAPESAAESGGSGMAGPQVVVLSAKEDARLREMAERLAAWLETEPECDLAAVAHTLQAGREAMKERLAIVASDAAELRVRLQGWLSRNGKENTWCGTADAAGGVARLLAGAEEMRGIVARWVERGEWGKVAEFWCLGGAVDWAAVKGGGEGRRVRLPTYPFAKERYWKPAGSVGNAAGRGVAVSAAMAAEGEVVCFEEVWEPCGAAATVTPERGSVGTVLCLLTDARRQADVRAELGRRESRARVFFVAQDEERSGGLVEALRRVVREAGAIDAVLNFKAVEDRGVLQDPAAPIAFVQALREAGLKPRRVVLAAGFANGLERSLAEAWVGVERSLGAAWPDVGVSVLLGEEASAAPEMAAWTARAWEMLGERAARVVLYRGGTAHELRRRAKEIAGDGGSSFLGKTVLITGGLGGLGARTTRWLAGRGAARLVLVGRSKWDGRVEEAVRALRAMGTDVHYVAADVANVAELGAALAGVRGKVGAIHGVVHAAGVKDERTIFEKPLEAARAVLAAKVAGTIALDAVLAEEPLEFVVYFSSVAAALGDFGACDYAVGNRFQLAYAEQRNALVAAGQRRGRTLAIGWGAWAEAGMGGEVKASTLHFKMSGQRPLRVEDGLKALEALLSGGGAGAAFVVAGESERVRQALGLVEGGVAGLRRELRGTLGRLLKLAPERIGEEQNFADFGLDSVSLVELARVLSETYAVELTPSLFFGYSTVKALAQHLWDAHGVREKGSSGGGAVGGHRPPLQDGNAGAGMEPIAIVGMSGRFAGARSVEEMWAGLRDGRCAVGEWPAERLGGVRAEGCWCGCVPGAGEFDPAFFEISPLEAESMDPRQRLLLQEGWNALEDAGWGAAELARLRVGMFVGAEEGDYQQRVTEGSITSNHGGVLASRLAYFLDLKGPVLAINTSCSSSLVALHQACLSLRAGECDAALVAGVNLITARETFAAMAEAGMLSAEGKCRAFDAEANGMVPGEAVAVVVLKRLERAVADGDAVHAVIAGSGVNYDGKTNGITAPNGVAQAELLRAVYRQSGVDPAEVGLVVTHGTGTRLGDPVEVNALREVFAGGGAAERTGPCVLVSCKPNLGHAFAASGLVSVIALVQALRHAMLPGSVNFARRNEFIRWEGAPFVVQTKSEAWAAPEAGRVRTGAVSAFGMSGTNAHAILREAPAERGAKAMGTDGAWYLLAWSAQTEEALLERTRGLVAYLKSGDVTDGELPALSCTLLLGRHHLRRRRAVVVRTIAEAVAALERAAAEMEGALRVEGDVTSEARDVTGLLVEAVAARRREAMERVAAAFRAGGTADWSVLFGGKRLRPLRLPTYPFARRNFWLPERRGAGVEADALRGFRARVRMPEFAAECAGSPDAVMEERASAVLAAILNGRKEAQEGAENGPEAGRAGYLEKWIEESERLWAESGRVAGGVTEAWAEWARVRAEWRGNEALEARAALLETALRGVPEILAGRRKATEVLFPESSVELVERVYRHDRVAALFNEAMANAVEAWVEARLAEEPGAMLRLIEVGAGTGGTTATVLPRLKRFGVRIAEYAYTDLSKAFLLHADERFVPEYPCVAPRLFDVSRSAAAQGLELGRYDLAIGANVLHATADIRAAVRNVKSVLRTGGGLMLSEVSANGWFTHLTFGLLEGWWLYRDAELRLRGCPGLSPQMWGRVLKEEGFGPVAFPAGAGHALGQQLIVAVSDGRVTAVAEQAVAETRSEQAAAPVGSGDADAGGRKRCVEYFRGLIARTLKMEPREIDPQQPLEAYGVDSLTIGKVLARLREVFADVPSTLLFETRTVAALADHFWEMRRAEVVAVLGDIPAVKAAAGVAREKANVSVTWTREAQAGREPIAIVGLSGRYPGAPDLRTFWENLRAGRDCIAEIPAERWALDGFFEADPERAIEEGKSYCKWGGFLERFSEFDPLFFKIAPREAMHMDPQERLFVQAAWEVLEDAGYTPRSLVERTGGRVGVFAGITHTDYNVFGPGQWRRGEKIYPRTSFSSVPNRVSFLLNLCGPSVPVDTMCSSSLTALHEACEAILRGDCAMAIAGAVNLCLHPSSYVGLCAARMLSRRGECHSFGVGEDGYIPGEGVGAVLLKRLSEAERDGDQIHAVIRGTAVNHGGRTNGYTVPDPQSQGRVVREALDRAGVSARTISYVEAHGTGTKLGDPIEVAGLTRAFRGDTSEVGFCAIGSVKSNVGHLEAAAGLVGLTKVILAMKHGELPPSLHAEELNPEIDFARTPFVVQRAVGRWERPTVNVGGKEETVPRRAGVSSFGAGGANAHVVVEEYVEARAGAVEAKVNGEEEPCVVVLSARDPERLKAAAGRLLAFVERTPEAALADVAFTLQVGREAMEERMGFLARSLADVARVLRAFVEDGRAEGLQRGAGVNARELLEAEELEELVTALIAKRKLERLVGLWVRGCAVDWHRIHGEARPRRISLPTYPFAPERYWFSDTTEVGLAATRSEARAAAGEWAFLCEAWEERTIPDDVDWQGRLDGEAGRRIAVVSRDRAEAQALAELLQRLGATAVGARPLRVEVLAPDEALDGDELPRVVFCLGSGDDATGDVKMVFDVSQKLMNACWGEPVDVFHLCAAEGGAARPECEALAGFVRAAMKENEQHVWTLIRHEAACSREARLQLLVREWLWAERREAETFAGVEVRHVGERREVKTLVETTLPAAAKPVFREGGVYLLAGGLGYLGQQVSLQLAKRYRATLVLLTRGALDEEKRGHCRRLEELGAKVVVEAVDIAEREALERVYRRVREKVGAVHGVFHLARQHDDRMIARKTWASFEKVVRTKVDGTRWLDELTKNEPLDFFAVFSSLGAYGVRGASDYSYATAFQNAFSRERERLGREGRRRGASVALCWGPWEEDRLFPESRAKLVEAGFALIGVAEGFAVLERALAAGTTPVTLVAMRDAGSVRRALGLEGGRGVGGFAEGAGTLAEARSELDEILARWENRGECGEELAVEMSARLGEPEILGMTEGQVNRVYRLLFGANGANGTSGASERKEARATEGGAEALAAMLRIVFTQVLQLRAIDDARAFQDYGMDSISGMQAAVRLEKLLKREVPPQWLINYPTIAALSRHLAAENFGVPKTE